MECGFQTCLFTSGLKKRWRKVVVASGSKPQERKRRYFATCSRGIGDILGAEVKTMVTENVTTVAASGVGFEGDQETGYRAAMCLRTAMRVLEEIGYAEADPFDVYRAVKNSVDWKAYLGKHQTFTVSVRSSSGGDRAIRTRVKDAICDALVDHTNARPLPPSSPKEADVAIFVSFHDGELTIYRDLGGESLHKRGYRPPTIHASSLNETAAAATAVCAGLAKSGSSGMIVDPMCGSATLLIEAALLKLRIAPGLFRTSYPFEEWMDYDSAAWEVVLEQAREAEIEPSRVLEENSFLGNDIHPAAVELARENVDRAGLSEVISISEGDVEDLRVADGISVVLSNPPWGLRLADEDGEAWKKLGLFLKQNARGGDAYLICGNGEATKELRMRADSKRPVRLGNVDCRILKYHVLKAKDPA
ncbi:hypothetical protein NDN08_005285 [Rhodosorus marinus]|uniref:THUMP domain-containing protein n=1 Tax=Rhodosorus marinus TaxID=101924 RepID=A0AAV8V147_9RHOD|nr:hypothetical protein NDN08_005285 [Rhodosorus marinus]